MSVEKALFSILQQELGGRTCPADCFDPRLRPAVMALSEKHSLAHIVANAYLGGGFLEKDDDAEGYRKAFMLEFYRSQQQSFVLTQVGNAFDQRSIPYVPLKGSVIRGFYPQSWMRSSCDIDILIRPCDEKQAIDTLLELGYQFQKTTSIHDHSLFSPQGIHLELHFSLIQEECLPQANALLEQAWAYTVPLEGTCRRELKSELFLVYHIAHMAKHFIMGGCGIRPFLDLWLLRGKMVVQMPTLEALLEEAGLLEFYEKVNQVVDVWFENHPHTQLTARIQAFILGGGVYGNQANVYAVRAAGGESRLQSFLKVMFMSRANLEYMYPRLEGRPWLLPYYQVKRWFGFFSKKRRNHLKQLTDARNAVTKSQAGSTADLLSQIGLSHQ